MTEKTKYLGLESLKSSNKMFGGTGHPKGNGASAGDGNTSDKSVLGKIIPKFLRG